MRLMNSLCIAFLPIVLSNFNCTRDNDDQTGSLHGLAPSVVTDSPREAKSVSYVSPDEFNLLKSKYDTLLPFMNGLFLTYSERDSVEYFRVFKWCFQDTKKQKKFRFDSPSTERGDQIWKADLDWNSEKVYKWGVIDSSGKVILPFICDGVRETAPNQGEFSVYSFAMSLNTGIPRYRYMGQLYGFTREGVRDTLGKSFSLTVVFVSDFYDPMHVIQQGPGFFLP